jgi:hypothetical protein
MNNNNNYDDLGNNNNDDGDLKSGNSKMTGKQSKKNSKRNTGGSKQQNNNTLQTHEGKLPHEEIPWLNDGGFFAFGQDEVGFGSLWLRRALFLAVIGIVLLGGWMMFENQRLLAAQVEEYNRELAE